MSCCNSCYSVPCCCPQVITTSTTTSTTTCEGAEPCAEAYQSDCVVYTGDDLACYGIFSGMTVTEIIEILIAQLPQCTTTTTTTTTTAPPCNCYTIEGFNPIEGWYCTDCDGVYWSCLPVPPEPCTYPTCIDVSQPYSGISVGLSAPPCDCSSITTTTTLPIG